MGAQYIPASIIPASVTDIMQQVYTLFWSVKKKKFGLVGTLVEWSFYVSKYLIEDISSPNCYYSIIPASVTNIMQQVNWRLYIENK